MRTRHPALVMGTAIALLVVSATPMMPPAPPPALARSVSPPVATPAPVEAVAPLRATSVVPISGYTCAVMEDGSLRCWGDNEGGVLGDGTLVDRWVPVVVEGLAGVTGVTGTWESTCALGADDTVQCWGDNEVGQLGDGTTTSRRTPGPVPGLAGVVDIDGGGFHVCAALDDGTARCWGWGESGELGDGTLEQRSTPVEVIADADGLHPLAGVVEIAAGADHTCALLGDGTIRCWGSNVYGQLGDGSTQDSPIPVVVTGIADAIGVGAGDDATCALLRDGSVECWGWNEAGQLGDGTPESRPLPGPVPGISTAVALAENDPSCALLADGSVVCWGYMAIGETMAGPSGVPGLAGIRSVASAGNTACAVTDDGAALCWGANWAGELGMGIDSWPTDRPLPVVGIGPPGTDTDQPTAPGRPSVRFAVGRALQGGRVPLAMTWAGSSDAGSGLAAPAYTVQGLPSWDSVFSWYDLARSTSTARMAWAQTGTSWTFRIVARDTVGHAAASASTARRWYRLVQESSSAIRYSGTWRRATSDHFSGGAVRAATRAGASASYTFTGRGIALVTTTGPSRGKVRVYVNGTRLATLDLYRPVFGCRTVAWAKTWSTSTTRTIRIVALGTPGRARVDVDAFVVVR